MHIDTFTEFVQTAISRLLYYKQLAEKTFDQLNDKDFQFSPGPESNSIGVIIQHMHGNMLSRWTNFLTEDGEKEWRKRDQEFEESNLSKKDYFKLWEQGWEVFISTLKNLEKNDLTRSVTIRNERLTVIDAINRQLAHYPYHVGQIVFIGRMIKKEQWQSLSIPKGGSNAYNEKSGIKDPAKEFRG
jgi:Protein of unknown function (DUF1572)